MQTDYTEQGLKSFGFRPCSNDLFIAVDIGIIDRYIYESVGQQEYFEHLDRFCMILEPVIQD